MDGWTIDKYFVIRSHWLTRIWWLEFDLNFLIEYWPGHAASSRGNIDCGFHPRRRTQLRAPNFLSWPYNQLLGSILTSQGIYNGWQTRRYWRLRSHQYPRLGPSSRCCHSILIICAGYKPAAGKSVDEYQKLDAGDESLARWKASLGLGSVSGDNNGPKVVLCIIDSLFAFIHSSPSLPSWAWSWPLLHFLRTGRLSLILAPRNRGRIMRKTPFKWRKEHRISKYDC